MFGCRTAIGVGSFVLALGAPLGSVGCGGSVVHGSGEGEPEPGVGGSSASGSGGSGGSAAGSGGKVGSAGSAGSTAQAGVGGSREPDPIDTGCPEEELPPPDLQCDPFDPASCGPGFGCYPYVDHPEGSGCDQQRYGTACAPAGSGTQGALCGGAADWCASGFVCVVGQRAGKRCAQLCDLAASRQCSGGLLCGELDVAGFGVCG
ncbi:MAG: hypothetical protein EOO73_03405 [Myxococcales bacterium]|nr:MAG: hypothetical protein EOO73_03405 [Myxococcales bacterium]